MDQLRYYIVSWIEYDLPGGLLGKFIPNHLVPILGQPAVLIKLFSDKKEAIRKLKDLKQLNAPKFYWVEGLRLYEKDVSFQVDMVVEDEVIST